MSFNDGAEGIFLTLEDCKVLFPRLKEKEPSLTKEERFILAKMEKVLYRNLSVTEFEGLFGNQESDKPGSRNA